MSDHNTVFNSLLNMQKNIIHENLSTKILLQQKCLTDQQVIENLKNRKHLNEVTSLKFLFLLNRRDRFFFPRCVWSRTFVINIILFSKTKPPRNGSLSAHEFSKETTTLFPSKLNYKDWLSCKFQAHGIPWSCYILSLIYELTWLQLYLFLAVKLGTKRFIAASNRLRHFL